LSKVTWRSTEAKWMSFDEVHKEMTFFAKSQRQSASVTIRERSFRLIWPSSFTLQRRIKMVSTNNLEKWHQFYISVQLSRILWSNPG
jgi:hypothetical protein